MKKHYDESSLPAWCQVIDQSENFLFLRHRFGNVSIGDVEFLLSIGLQCCGISPSEDNSCVIGCLKVAPCGS